MAPKQTSQSTAKSVGKAKAPVSPPYTEEEQEIEGQINKGEHVKALDRILEIEARGKTSVRIRELKGLVFARWGRLNEAQEVLGKLYDEAHRGAETLGIYARTWMDRYDKSGELDALRRSRDLYAESF